MQAPLPAGLFTQVLEARAADESIIFLPAQAHNSQLDDGLSDESKQAQDPSLQAVILVRF